MNLLFVGAAPRQGSQHGCAVPHGCAHEVLCVPKQWAIAEGLSCWAPLVKQFIQPDGGKIFYGGHAQLFVFKLMINLSLLSFF